eukprot:1196197-Prorocentrum_minimum.AAC.1
MGHVVRPYTCTFGIWSNHPDLVSDAGTRPATPVICSPCRPFRGGVGGGGGAVAAGEAGAADGAVGAARQRGGAGGCARRAGRQLCSRPGRLVTPPHLEHLQKCNT